MLADCADTFLEQVCTCKTVQPTSKQKQQQRQQQQQQHRQPKFGDFFFKGSSNVNMVYLFGPLVRNTQT